MTLTRAPTSTLSPALEAFAVQLETRVEGAWKTLLSQVTPTFGDPIAAQIAHLMKTYKADGEYDGQLIRKMLSEKDDLATALPDTLPEDDEDDDDSDWPSDSEDSEDSEDSDGPAQYAAIVLTAPAWNARRTRYLETLPKNVLIDMINMEYHEKEEMIGDNM